MFMSCDASRFARDLAMTWLAGASVAKVRYRRGEKIWRHNEG